MRDDNRVSVAKAALNTDGSVVQNIYVNPTNHCLSADDDTSGSDKGRLPGIRDDRIPVLVATSSADGITPVEVYADSNGKLLIQST